MGVDDEAVEKQQHGTQCGNAKNFLSLIFYVELVFVNLNLSKIGVLIVEMVVLSRL